MENVYSCAHRTWTRRCKSGRSCQRQTARFRYTSMADLGEGRMRREESVMDRMYF
jgi:hypothetical protein